MKKRNIYLLSALLMLFLSSCGLNTAIILNHNQAGTEVQLSQNNFKIIDRVSGSAEVVYIFGIGGLNKRQLFSNAYSEMMKNASLSNGSKAIANVITEEHISGVPPFFMRRTVTVSAHVVEFTR